MGHLLFALWVAVLPVCGAAVGGRQLLRARRGSGNHAGQGDAAAQGSATAARGPLGNAIGAILGGGTANDPDEAAKKDSVWGEEGTTLPGTNVPGKVVGDLNVTMTAHGPHEHVIVPVKHKFFVNQTGNFTVAFNVSMNMTVKPEVQHWTPGVVIVDSAMFRPPPLPGMPPLQQLPCGAPAPAAAPPPQIAWPPPPCWLPPPPYPPPPVVDATGVTNQALQEITNTHMAAMKSIYESNRAMDAAKTLRADLIKAARARAAELSKIRAAPPTFR